MKKTHFIVQFICISVVLAAILLQSVTHFVELKPLKGFDKEEKKPVELTFKAYYDGSYQNYLTEHAKRNTGFREFFIRNYNQLVYSCFRKSTNLHVEEGLQHELYLRMYLNEVIGQTLKKEYSSVEDAMADAQNNVKETLKLIDTLQRHGTKFLFVFAPSKTRVYPENMPKYYRENIAEFSLEDYYIELFKENNIPHIDFLNYFKSIKDDVSYPLYTRTGTHWAAWTIPFVADSIFRKLESVTDYTLPSIQIVDENLTTDYTVQDRELEISMNLLFPLNNPDLPRPVFTLTNTENANRPNLLVVGDSYFVQLKESSFVDAFHQWDYWMYNRDSYSSRPYYEGKQLKWMLDADEVLEDADIVMAVFTAPMLYTYMFDFTHTALALFDKGHISEAEALEITIQRIKENPEWMQAIETQAQERGITVEENLRRNAKYTIETEKQKRNPR